MIRKPDASEFRESGSVTALRDAGAFAREGAKGVREGTAGFVRRAMTGVFSLGFVMSILGHVGPVVVLLGLAGAAAWFAQRRKRRTAELDARWGRGSSAAQVGTASAVSELYALEAGPVGRRVAVMAVPAILFFPTTYFAYMLPFALAGIVCLAVAMLLVARLFGDRTVVRFDSQVLTVVGLLGEATILWADVGDVIVRKSSIFNLRVLFTSGARRNLQILGRLNRLGGPATLYIPIDLLGLEADQLHALITRMLACRATAGDLTPAPAPAPASRPAPPAPVLWTTAESPAPGLRPTPVPIMADAAFDPDAIIARYMATRAAAPEPPSPALDLEALRATRQAEREQVRADTRPDLAPRRGTFGRKVG